MSSEETYNAIVGEDRVTRGMCAGLCLKHRD
jgi:hypothetical protein